MLESLRAKMMNNVSRMTSAPTNSIISKPQVSGENMPNSLSLPNISMSSGSPHHSTSEIESVSSTPSSVVSASHHNSAISTSYQIDQAQIRACGLLSLC
ncbi:hypothetical protein TNCV_973021 [Trichonephila clavipes]|nr:hypothetical protein TNCV_973021 [Trichonephila clavipes]